MTGQSEKIKRRYDRLSRFYDWLNPFIRRKWRKSLVKGLYEKGIARQLFLLQGHSIHHRLFKGNFFFIYPSIIIHGSSCFNMSKLKGNPF